MTSLHAPQILPFRFVCSVSLHARFMHDRFESNEIDYRTWINILKLTHFVPYVVVNDESRSFENSYIPENPRTPKPLTFSKNRLRGAKNRSNISPVAKKNFRKNDFFFQKLCICANFFFVHMSLYNTYLKSCTYAQKIKKSCTYAKVKKKYRFFGNFFQRIVMIKNVLEGSEVGFLKGITVWEI
ncbi:hypothetical protein LXL04_034679 [Taraxacum kok-saghyz]